MPRDPFRPPPRPQFGTQPVWRGTPPKPLWGMRGGVMVPLFAADPCDPTCCPGYSDCQGCLDDLTGILVTISNATDQICTGFSLCSDPMSACKFTNSNLNGSYALDEPNGGGFGITLGDGLCGTEGIVLLEGCPQDLGDGRVMQGRAVLRSFSATILCNGSDVEFTVGGGVASAAVPLIDGICNDELGLGPELCATYGALADLTASGSGPFADFCGGAGLNGTFTIFDCPGSSVHETVNVNVKAMF